ncbi:hypothetical protein JQ581_22205 [Bradyrhizobium liaoningense]|uniref:phosphoribosyltransferase-like protein n=1 Tax=Bradyrhizobium liaoningense TaxID=43992 RepID=UPI001BA749AA|nr:hypothetical protein [Bradyrhizobium liaoningense]MBR0739650.1 hypothetical protein [Bradyrhizobium liaoningense]
MAKLKNVDSFLHLLKVIVRDASKKKGSQVQAMTLAVLNNRLLQKTFRTFEPRDYGANSLRELIEALHPAFELKDEKGGSTVTFHDLSLTAASLGTSATAADSQARPPVAVSAGRIRSDLWASIMDYSSGNRYVWDERKGIARKASNDDTGPLLPTILPEEFRTWRTEFLKSDGSTLTTSDLAIATRWCEKLLPTSSLPTELQGPWNKELNRRVRDRLSSFFSSREKRSRDDEGEGDQRDRSGFDQLVDEEMTAAVDRGDFFLVGELVARRLELKTGIDPSAALARMVAAWSITKGPLIQPDSVSELVGRLDALPSESVALALVSAIRRLRKSEVRALDAASDLTFRVQKSIASAFGLEEKRSPNDTCTSAIAKLDEKLFETSAAVDRFLKTTPGTAKAASIELLKSSHNIQPLLISFERGFLRDLEVLIGPAFRKFCEAYERDDHAEVLRRAPELLDNIKRHSPGPEDARTSSSVWKEIISPVLSHLLALLEDATSRGAVVLAPVLKLRNSATKANLRVVDRDIILSFSLQNSGRGHATDISLQCLDDVAQFTVLAEPVGPFDIPPGGEQLVRLQVLVGDPTDVLKIPVRWICQTPMGTEASFEDEIIVTQQVTEPNWEALVSDPPYSLNPIRRADRLYGRDTALQALNLAAMSGASKFVWGQKRVGKTSLLQVVATKLVERPDTTCLVLRMGELTSLHEGELGHLIARRLIDQSGLEFKVPNEADFGASIGRLVPFIEQLAAKYPRQKLVVIIDEFDDLDPSFYTGERGKQFVKALRSLSEVGLTFFFVGSERMEAIYHHHQADLNKWTNVHLDRIDSRSECRSLIVNPVADVIEFSREAVELITDFCGGNPFYINNFCYQVFERCLQEHRTFVDDNDTLAAQNQLLRALGPTNFSHFWEDNPLLDAKERRDAVAQNCVALTCIAVLGGSYEDLEELYEVQDSLPLSAAQRSTRDDLREACNRLMSRRILVPHGEGRFALSLPIFREWLEQNAVSKLLPIWIAHCDRKRSELGMESLGSSVSEAPLELSSFVIPEDDLIAVSQRLVFCGKQKDVADIRSWLRQFDDDTRIEVAFLLLKRLVERGFFNEGARGLATAKLEEMIRARRLDVGGKAWKVERGRIDNLCLAFVDSDLKSGATLVRELKNMMRPGKSGAAKEISQWMQSHADHDPMVVILDDFAASGSSLVKGISTFRKSVDPQVWRAFAENGRISIFVMFAFPEAIESVRAAYPSLHVVAANTLGDDVRALSSDASIFENESDIRFARDMLLQFGRELYPDAPLGFGDIGALVAFHNAVPNNTLPIFWSNGRLDRPWKPLFPRA